jgi:hypothetical protein
VNTTAVFDGSVKKRSLFMPGFDSQSLETSKYVYILMGWDVENKDFAVFLHLQYILYFNLSRDSVTLSKDFSLFFSVFLGQC